MSDLVAGCTARPCVVCDQPAHDTGQDCRTLAHQARHEALAEAKARGWRVPTVDEALNPELDQHGFPTGACPICRRGAA